MDSERSRRMDSGRIGGEGHVQARYNPGREQKQGRVKFVTCGYMLKNLNIIEKNKKKL